MRHKAKVAVCSEIRTKHSTQSEHHVEFWMLNPGVSKEIAKFWKVNPLPANVENMVSSEKC